MYDICEVNKHKIVCFTFPNNDSNIFFNIRMYVTGI